MDTNIKECQPCHFSCLKCYAEGNSGCIECSTGYHFESKSCIKDQTILDVDCGDDAIYQQSTKKCSCIDNSQIYNENNKICQVVEEFIKE